MARMRLIQHKLYKLCVEHKKQHKNCINVSFQLSEQGTEELRGTTWTLTDKFCKTVKGATKTSKPAGSMKEFCFAHRLTAEKYISSIGR